MIKKVNPIPHGHHSITPYLIVSDAHDALHYYEIAFNAEELTRLITLDGKVAHAEILIGDSHVMLADEFPQMNIFSPTTFGGTAVTLNLYVDDVDTVFQQAVAAGGKIFRPLQNHIYGDRSATIVDPFGHQWTIATHIEDVTAEEIEKRFLNFKQD
jgi:PhnB protein